MALKLIGGVVFALGVVLWTGNVFGFLRTIPFVGYLTMLAGGAMFKAGARQG